MAAHAVFLLERLGVFLAAISRGVGLHKVLSFDSTSSDSMAWDDLGLKVRVVLLTVVAYEPLAVLSQADFSH